MRKHPFKLRALKGIPPGIYTVDLSDGVAPGTEVDVEAVDAEWLIKAAEGTGQQREGLNIAGAAEKMAPAIASLAIRFLG